MGILGRKYFDSSSKWVSEEEGDATQKMQELVQKEGTRQTTLGVSADLEKSVFCHEMLGKECHREKEV
jgi:hypothetical protein